MNGNRRENNKLFWEEVCGCIREFCVKSKSVLGKAGGLGQRIKFVRRDNLFKNCLRMIYIGDIRLQVWERGGNYREGGEKNNKFNVLHLMHLKIEKLG